MNKVLILFAHPRFEQSKTNRALLAGIEGLQGVTAHDLYEEYPDFNIHVERERAILLDHNVMIWHHPFYMYGAPALLKQWMDVVLEFAWARGRGSDTLQGKTVCNVLTVGGTRQVYRRGALHHFTIREFLTPFEQSATLCKMTYLPPFVVHGTHLLTADEHRNYGIQYAEMLKTLVAGTYDPNEIKRFEYFNDWLAAPKDLPS